VPDVLRSARWRRETYVGPWLPELVEDESDDVGDVTLPLMLALERLSPLERAAFLLHDVFGVGFEEVSETIVGIEAVMELHEALARLFARNAWRFVRYASINGVPGFVTGEPDGLLQATALEGGEQLRGSPPFNPESAGESAPWLRRPSCREAQLSG
jgi:hypothetical protein